jgi:hypothetical protein
MSIIMISPGHPLLLAPGKIALQGTVAGGHHLGRRRVR